MATPWISLTHFGDSSALQVYPGTFHSLPIDSHSYPTLVTLIGDHEKSHLLRALLGDSADYPLLPHGQIHVWADPSTLSCQQPNIIIDCELNNYNSSQTRSPPMHLAPKLSRNLTWLGFGDHAEACTAVTANILHPLSDVIYIFASDMGGLDCVAHLIAQQITTYTRMQTVRPHLVIVVDEPICQKMNFICLLEKSIEAIGMTDGIDHTCRIDHNFSAIEILFLGRSNRNARTTIFRQHMSSSAALQRRNRRADNLAFKFSHLEALFLKLVTKVSGDPSSSFSFIQASRPSGYDSSEFESHLSELLHIVPSEGWLWHLVVPMVSASILLSCYPPGTHVFSSDRLFEELYRKSCEKALEEYTINAVVRAKFYVAVQEELRIMVEKLGTFTAKQIYLERMRKLRAQKELRLQISCMQSNKSCLACLHLMPERVLQCNHSLCDTCLRTFGERSATDPNRYHVESCHICGESQNNFSVKLVPPTAGVRLLSIDGGGVRCAIAMTFLVNLESALKPFGCPLWEHFDLVCGTSAGGIIALGISPLRWSAEKCLERFLSLSCDIFRKRVIGSSMIARMQDLFLAYFEDGQYTQKAIDTSFGQAGTLKLFSPYTSDTKVFVTSTTAKDTRACIFTNYNGRQRSNSTAPAGYDVVRADNVAWDVTISDAAKCTSAAPWYFKPHTLPYLGTHQDGGLQYNMPMGIAYWEQNFIWPEKVIDFGISLGTGARKASLIQTGPTSPVKDGCASRMYRAFLESIDGEREWCRFRNSLPKDARPRFHRLNIPLPGKEPSIDDVKSISQLQHDTQSFIEKNEVLQPVLDSIYASMFYFKLDRLPEYVDGLWQCSGGIYCRIEMNSEGRSYLYSWLTSQRGYFLVNGRPTQCCPRIPEGLPPFRCAVEFAVEDQEDFLGISVRGITSRPKLISGCPTTVAKLIAAQMFDAPFGRTDHYVEKPLPRPPAKRKLSDLADKLLRKRLDVGLSRDAHPRGVYK